MMLQCQLEHSISFNANWNFSTLNAFQYYLVLRFWEALLSKEGATDTSFVLMVNLLRVCLTILHI